MSAKTDGARSNPTYNAQVQKYSILKVIPPGIICLMHFEGFLDEKLSENQARYCESNSGTDKKDFEDDPLAARKVRTSFHSRSRISLTAFFTFMEWAWKLLK